MSKQLFTSYFARNGKHPNAISISRFPPWFLRGKVKEFLPLAPSKTLLAMYKAGDVDEAGYTEIYNRGLQGLSAQHMVDQLPDKAILLCWEGSNKFCHRHLAATWITNETGIVVRELGKDEVVS